jgi:hypothetical protein
LHINFATPERARMRTHLVAYLRDHVGAVTQQLLLNLRTKTKQMSSINYTHLLLMHRHATRHADQTRTRGHGHHK